MARLARAEIFYPSEIVAVHFIGKTVRFCRSCPILISDMTPLPSAMAGYDILHV